MGKKCKDSDYVKSKTLLQRKKCLFVPLGGVI